VARDALAGRLAARLYLLHALDPGAAAQLARIAELHLDACRRLAAAEQQETAGAATLERVSGSRDEVAAMLELVGRLGRVAAGLRGAIKARRQGYRREIERWETALGYRDPPRGRRHRLASGQEVGAIEWVDGAGPRQVEPP
jgi:hypothetical protein